MLELPNEAFESGGTAARGRGPNGETVDPLIAWAAGAAADRRVLVVGRLAALDAEHLTAAGATWVEGIATAAPAGEESDRWTEASAGADRRHAHHSEPRKPLALSGESYELALCLDGRAPELKREGAVAELHRFLSSDGLLLVSFPAEGAKGYLVDPIDDLRDALTRAFSQIAVYRERIVAVSLLCPETSAGPVDSPPASLPVPSGAGAPGRLLLAASDRSLPALPLDAAFGAASGGSQALTRRLEEAATAWEQRARGAEAEAAVTRWELYIVREAWNAALARLAQLERHPLHRLPARLRHLPWRRGSARRARR